MRAWAVGDRGHLPVDNAAHPLDIQKLIVADISCASLRLTSPWDKECVVLVRATDAIRLCRDDGYEELPSHQALAWLKRLGRQQAAEVRAFVSGTRISSVSLAKVDDPSLLTLLRGKVRMGELAAILEGDGVGSGEGDSGIAQRRLIREIEAKTQRRLSYGGRQYRLVVDASLRRLSDRDSYEVVKHQDAVTVLRGLAGQGGPGSSGLGTVLTEAADMLTQDWRPPQTPDGLVLLRRILVKNAYKPDMEPALTPSQIKTLGKSDWIEIDLVDQDDEPYATHYKLELVDRSVREGEFDSDGYLGVFEIESGTCKLTVGETKLPAGEAEAARTTTATTEKSEGPGTPTGAPQVPSPEFEAQAAAPVEVTIPNILRLKLLDLLGNPAAGVTVSVVGKEVTSDDDGMVETEVNAAPGSLLAILPAGEVSFDVGALDVTSTKDDVWKIRLFNLGFLWDAKAEVTDDEMMIALQDFQAQFEIKMTGQLDEATKAKLAEVYGC